MSDNPEPGQFAQLHAFVEGRVQGVGFRYFVVDSALSLGLTGWVRNRWNGSVEVMAEGPRPVLEKLLQALRVGPRASNVETVTESWADARGEWGTFTLRSTSD